MIYDGGVYREEDKSETEAVVPELTYKQKIIERIRAKYSMDDEIALLRQRNTKPEEFEEYNNFVEKIKAEIRDETAPGEEG